MDRRDFLKGLLASGVAAAVAKPAAAALAEWGSGRKLLAGAKGYSVLPVGNGWYQVIAVFDGPLPASLDILDKGSLPIMSHDLECAEYTVSIRFKPCDGATPAVEDDAVYISEGDLLYGGVQCEITKAPTPYINTRPEGLLVEGHRHNLLLWSDG